MPLGFSGTGGKNIPQQICHSRSYHRESETNFIPILCCKVKVVPYTFVCRGVPVREDTYPEPSAYEVGWPVPFLAAFISPVLPPGANLLLGEQ